MDEVQRSKADSGAVAREADLEPTYTDKAGNVYKKRILTGDRTTGKLHLGHYVGSLRNRVKYQSIYDTFILMADVQALTTHWDKPEILKESVMDVALDYMAVGQDPYTGGADDQTKAKIVVQSHVPAIAELTVLYGLITPMGLLTANPTTKAEAEQYGMSGDQTRYYDEHTFKAFRDNISAVTAILRFDYEELGDIEEEEVYAAIKELLAEGKVDVQHAIGKYATEAWEGTKKQATQQFEFIQNVALNAGPDDEHLRELIDPFFNVLTFHRKTFYYSHLPPPADLVELLSKATELSEEKSLDSNVLFASLDQENWVYGEIFQAFSGILMSDIGLRRVFREMVISIRRRRGLKSMSYGFLGYPVSQAADITFVNAHLVPVGEDQVPHIELTREIVRRMNKQYGGRRRFLVEPQALVGGATIKGLDGNAKMSKSLGNAVYLSDSDEDIWGKVKKAVTDPQRIRKDDPGRPEICNIFAYHQQFNATTEPSIKDAALSVPTEEETAGLCRSAGIGCVDCKKNLMAKLTAMLNPMRERRAAWEKRPDELIDILKAGTRRGNEEGNATVARVKSAMHVDYWK